ncbi:MAG: META domain-containing protein [Pseudomonadota bacterium]
MMPRTTLLAAAFLLSTACAHADDVSGTDGAAAVSGASAAGATGTERSRRVDRDELINTGGWALVSATGGEGANAVRAQGIAFEMSFDRGEVVANGGCNTIRGGYTVAGKRMSFEVAITTRMACTDDKNLADRSFVELLNREFKAELLEPMPYRLRLTGDEGQVLEFQAKPLRF